MGVYVKCYCFSIFVVVDSVYYKYQYRITYTLCCGLNRLQVYVTEIKEKQIFVFLLFLSHTRKPTYKFCVILYTTKSKGGRIYENV